MPWAPGASQPVAMTAVTVCLLRAALCSPTKIGPRGIGTKWGEVKMSECPCTQGRRPGTALAREPMASPHRSLFDDRGIPGTAPGCASLERVVQDGLGTSGPGMDGGPARRCPQRALDTRGMPGHQGQINFQSPGPPWFRPNSISFVHVNDDRSWMGGDSNLTPGQLTFRHCPRTDRPKKDLRAPQLSHRTRERTRAAARPDEVLGRSAVA